MKRILVIDESEVVRDTLALILGREFAVAKRALNAPGLSLADAREECDLLILGVSPRYGLEAASIVRVAAQLPFAVLLLVESKSTARDIEGAAEVGCLTKPFNPYELHEKVGQLLARRLIYSSAEMIAPARAPGDLARYLEYPYLSRSAATLVRRFAATQLPLLIYGELGCGQNRIAAAVHGVQKYPGRRVSINAPEVNAEYLAKKSQELYMGQGAKAAPITLEIENLCKSSASNQSLLLHFLDDLDEKYVSVRYVATASTDLLEKVYHGDFSENLYFRLATLTLKLLPLRQRGEDIPTIADWFARTYAEALEVAVPVFSTEAQNRLRNYLWFGNLNELETVVARTLALHGKPRIEADELFFDFGVGTQESGSRDPAEFVSPRTDHAVGEPRFQVYGGLPAPNGSANGHGKSVDLNVVIHELAHELKNPMVTIKTFAQLLSDRYQDENFRSRFQEVVGSDIERMDDLLEVMLEFADFGQPRRSNVALREKLREALQEIHKESDKRQLRFEWKGNGAAHEIKTDEAQLSYILKNLLLATLSEARMGSEIEIDITQQGAVSFAYLREGARVTSITHYLNGMSPGPNQPLLPLRMLLAKQLVERNGGQLFIDQSNNEKDILRIEFPVVEH